MSIVDLPDTDPNLMIPRKVLDEKYLSKEVVLKAIEKVHREYQPTGDDIRGTYLFAIRLIRELGL